MSMDASTVEKLRQEYVSSPTITGWLCLLIYCCEALREKINKISEKQARGESLLVEKAECEAVNLVYFIKSFLPPTQSKVAALSGHGIFAFLNMFDIDHQYFQRYPLHVTYMLAHLFQILSGMVLEYAARVAYLNSANYCLQLANQIGKDEELQPVLKVGMEELEWPFNDEQEAYELINQLEQQWQARRAQVPDTDILPLNVAVMEVDMQNVKAFHQANHSTSFRM